MQHLFANGMSIPTFEYLRVVFSISSAESVNTPQPKRKSVRTDEGTMDDIREMIGQLGSNDWKTRHAGITQFQQMTESNPNAVSSQLVKVSWSTALQGTPAVTMAALAHKTLSEEKAVVKANNHASDS